MFKTLLTTIAIVSMISTKSGAEPLGNLFPLEWQKEGLFGEGANYFLGQVMADDYLSQYEVFELDGEITLFQSQVLKGSPICITTSRLDFDSQTGKLRGPNIVTLWYGDTETCRLEYTCDMRDGIDLCSGNRETTGYLQALSPSKAKFFWRNTQVDLEHRALRPNYWAKFPFQSENGSKEVFINIVKKVEENSYQVNIKIEDTDGQYKGNCGGSFSGNLVDETLKISSRTSLKVFVIASSEWSRNSSLMLPKWL